MKKSFILGILGGIFAILVSLLIFILYGFESAWNSSFGSQSQYYINGVSQLSTLVALTLIAGIIGIVGAVIGKKIGGALMILAAVLVVIGSSFFGVLSLILFLLGGILALREKPQPIQSIQQQPIYQQPPYQQTAFQQQPTPKIYCFSCGAENSHDATFCSKCGQKLARGN